MRAMATVFTELRLAKETTPLENIFPLQSLSSI